ncbi:MAG TPA: TolC family outer membrane protein, partial [Gammaproteobacteria bacterium]
EIYLRALDSDPVLREAEATYLASAEARPQARSALLPSLTLESGLDGSRSETTGPFGIGPIDLGDPVEITTINSRGSSDSLNLRLSQPLLNFANLRNLRQAEKTVAQAETDLAAARQELLLRVADAYFNVLAAEDTLAAEIAARESLSQQLEQAQRRFDVGLIAITDVQEARAGYDQSVANVIAAERALATSHEFLREIIGDEVTDLRSPGENLPLVNPEPFNVDEWVAAAEEQNLALISSRIGADIAQDEIDKQRAARLPTVSLSGNLGTTSSDNFGRVQDADSLRWALSFQMPVFTGGINRSRIQQSVYRHRAAIETLERVARQTERQTRDAYLGVISEISRVDALRQALESSQTALLATQAGEEVGQRTVVDVVNAQNNVRRAETTYAQARYEYLLNVLRLKQASGSLTQDDLAEIDGWLE